MKNKIVSLCLSFGLLGIPCAFAQTPDMNSPDAEGETDPNNEIVVHGQRSWGNHEGMNAFFNGDFETAEIEFEQEFLTLKRGESARENAAIDAANQQFRADQLGSVSGTSGGSSGGQGGPPTGFDAPGNVSSGVSNNFQNKRATGKSLLTDGKVTYKDFAFTRYMAGLSEIQLGKISEAKDSFKSSLHYDHTNFDARMRLGLIYIQENDFEKAAKQLEKLDKLRKKCIKVSCDDLDLINESTVTLAKSLTHSSQTQ